MEPAENNENEVVESRGHDLPCHDWRVDEPVWIDIRGGQDFVMSAATIDRAGSKGGSGPRGGIRGGLR
jgi:hypothetical protein